MYQRPYFLEKIGRDDLREEIVSEIGTLLVEGIKLPLEKGDSQQ